MQNGNFHRKQLLALALLAPLIAGCSGASMGDMFQSDLLSRDADWFKRTGRLTIENVSVPPLNPDKPITANDLVGPRECARAWRLLPTPTHRRTELLLPARRRP